MPARPGYLPLSAWLASSSELGILARLIIHTTTRIVILTITIQYPLSPSQVEASTQHFYHTPKHVSLNLRGYSAATSTHLTGCSTVFLIVHPSRNTTEASSSALTNIP
jgi:hypothetical protein